MSITMQIGKECKRMLASVRRICESGNVVNFENENNYIQNKESGRKIAIYINEGTYAFDMWIKKENESNDSCAVGKSKNEEESDFVRLGDELL